MNLINKLKNMFKKKKKKVCNCKFCQQKADSMLGKYQKPAEQLEGNKKD